jgi:TolA-binding protein
VVAFAAAALLAIFAGWALQRPEAAMIAHSLGPQLRQLSLPPAIPPIRAVVSKAPEARFERQAQTGTVGRSLERVRLYEGKVDVHVEPLAEGQRFLVATGDAEAEVRGTRFSVRAADDILQEVVVHEGRVELRRGALVTMLSAGEVWRIPEHAARIHAPAEAPARRIYATPRKEPAPRSTAAPGAKDPSPAPQRDKGASSRAFADAVGKLEAGDFDGASEALLGFAEAHGSDARAEDADFLAIVALQRAGKQEAAAQAARQYLRRYPEGARRAEARAIAGEK